MARLQSDVSTGKAGKKGAALNAVGDDVGPKPSVTPNNNQFQQSDFGAVNSNHKGRSLSQRGQRGGGPTVAGGTPLTGHTQIDPTAVGAEAPGATITSGNHNPKRSAGKKTAFTNPAVMD
jgi:hypothetical protein